MKWIMMVMSMVFGRYPAVKPPVHVHPPQLNSAPDSYWDNRYGY